MKPREAQSPPPLDQICEPIDVTEMHIGKWYDPISERWIAPRETRAIAADDRSSAEQVAETHKREEAQRIWNLLVDCCARG
ncbi:hypothetical protein ABIG06_000380 [Bradyrhizobium sp. USDA 326]